MGIICGPGSFPVYFGIIYDTVQIKELEGRGWLSNKETLQVFRLTNRVFKAWNSATPAQGSGSTLLLLSLD